ncbi:MAG: cofactor-independent phosphoglycerate mutase [Deltaproteobacteria bacterium]|nr:cofactor-independent phosphoglycerate mutase [Candidatus Anaeroferrophillacea bacterium]
MGGEKYLIVLGDGMADEPREELDGRTPLEAAATPNLDRLAATAELGTLTTIPAGYPAGSDVANLAVFGYDPARYYTGRAPLEAASMGIELGPADVAFRCNLVNILHYQGHGYMHDFSAGHIGTDEARIVIQALNDELATDEFRFHPGVSYRHLLAWRDCPAELAALTLTPPHDITGQEIIGHLPDDPSNPLLQLMLSAQMVIHRVPLIREKQEAGEETANAIWLWGQGRKPRLTSFFERFGKTGVVISAVDLLKGIGICAGLEALDVPGATGYLDTSYENKAEWALRALADHDFVYLHVEAPDEASHEGSLEKKIRAIEDLDRRLLGPLLEGLERFAGYRLAVLPDHQTPIRTRTHAAGPVPYLLYDSGVPVSGAPCYGERTAAAAGRHWPAGWEFIDRLMQNQ